MGVASLGYVILEMQDPTAWAKFAKSVLGFGTVKSFGEKGAKYLRMDNAPFRYMIRKGETDRFICGGYQMSSKKAYEDQIKTFEKAKIEVCRGDARGAKHRAVKGFASVTDPSGNILEFFYGRDKGEPFTPGHGIKSFKTGKMGLGHMVLPAPENKKTIDFYRKLMGFGISDDLTLPAFAEGLPNQRIYFMHADNPRHHTLGLYNFPNPTGVIHLMAEVNTIDEVGMCMDRVKEAGLHIFASLGRHANDEMISFYFFAPGGIGFEVGYEGKQIKDWSKFKPTKSKIGDLWGHEYDFPVVGE
jgi:3,4-dihydroxy-9,10-secoandrosta-1,3,5(10)-triene-9,17-dione 4,5-dioxygenase